VLFSTTSPPFIPQEKNPSQGVYDRDPQKYSSHFKADPGIDLEEFIHLKPDKGGLGVEFLSLVFFIPGSFRLLIK
jgi:hypothetical protein